MVLYIPETPVKKCLRLSLWVARKCALITKCVPNRHCLLIYNHVKGEMSMRLLKSVHFLT